MHKLDYSQLKAIARAFFGTPYLWEIKEIDPKTDDNEMALLVLIWSEMAHNVPNEDVPDMPKIMQDWVNKF